MFGLFAFACDSRGRHLVHYFSMENQLFTFYYLMGLFCSLSLVGIISSLERAGCLDYPRGVCCCDCFAGAGGCRDCGDCLMATFANLGQELIILSMALLVVFAFIGIFVCVMLGVAFLQAVVSKHIAVLQRYSLTQEYLVLDLALDTKSSLTNGQVWTDVESQSVSDEGRRLWPAPKPALALEMTCPTQYTRLHHEEHDSQLGQEPIGDTALSASPATVQLLERDPSLFLSASQKNELSSLGLL
jgi:hypothetical protein